MAHAYKTPLGMHALLGAVFFALAVSVRDCQPAETQQTKPRDQHQDIFDAWARRAQRVQSLHFEWTQQETIPKGSLGPLPVAGPQWPPPSRDPVIPSEDVTVEARFSLLMDDSKLRLWKVGEFFRQDLNRTVHTEFGQISTSVEYMHIDLETYSGHPYAGINRGSNRGSVASASAQLPFRLAYRMYGTDSHPWFSNDWEIVKRYTDELDTRACTVLDLVWRDHPELTGKLWLDHRRDFLPLRYTSFHESAARETGDWVITYEESAEHGPILKSWTLKQYDMKGNLTQTYVSNVEQYAINVPIPDDKFEVELPTGTNVTVVTDSEGVSDYVILPNGIWRPFQQGEDILDYHSMMATRLPVLWFIIAKEWVKKNWGHLKFYLIGLSTLVLIVVAWTRFRKLRQTARN